jgi:hypothetical protein
VSPEQRPGENEEELIARLQQRLDRASEAAERLLSETILTARTAVRDRVIPPAGWQVPGEGGARPAGDVGSDVELLTAVLGQLRQLVPPELQRRLSEALRELLLAVRALIDSVLERAERHRAQPPEVRDIPIL